MLHSLHVRGVRSAVCSVRVGRKLLIYLTRPRNHLTCFVVVGAGQLRISLTLELSASIPHDERWWPKKSISVAKRVDFLSEQ